MPKENLLTFSGQFQKCVASYYNSIFQVYKFNFSNKKFLVIAKTKYIVVQILDLAIVTEKVRMYVMD